MEYCAAGSLADMTAVTGTTLSEDEIVAVVASMLKVRIMCISAALLGANAVLVQPETLRASVLGLLTLLHT